MNTIINFIFITAPDPPASVILHAAGLRNFTLNVTEPTFPNGILQSYIFKLQKRLYSDLNYDDAPVVVTRNYSVGMDLFAFDMDSFGANFIVPGEVQLSFPFDVTLLKTC